MKCIWYVDTTCHICANYRYKVCLRAQPGQQILQYRKPDGTYRVYRDMLALDAPASAIQVVFFPHFDYEVVSQCCVLLGRPTEVFIAMQDLHLFNLRNSYVPPDAGRSAYFHTLRKDVDAFVRKADLPRRPAHGQYKNVTGSVLGLLNTVQDSLHRLIGIPLPPTANHLKPRCSA